MAKIQPLPAASSSPSADECQSLQGEQVYTLWMKSLVFNGNGCTVYGADGSVAFRVDNYDFMDGAGEGFGETRLWTCGSECTRPKATEQREDVQDRWVREQIEYKISGAVVVAIGRKQMVSRVFLGEDVLRLTVGSEVDHLPILSMVVVCGLMNRCM
ncbi:protein LURP-one-related 4-like [Phragmites australis]|uniref:protein LURP-one-related 4-like n=1 Tax=Phragmites australis TaxID=29695 RepID=UPI002D79706D|nr:protein LURP-one-related 4-like [Phragmites australis]